jgi:TIR domain
MAESAPGDHLARPETMKKSKSAEVTNGVVHAPYQIFISHATADKWIARVICEKLELAGATTFRDDRDINGGDDIPDEIRRQIKASKELLVLLTPQSVGRNWILFETGAAWGTSKKMRIVVVRYHVDVDPVPDMIRSKKSITLNDFDTYLAEVGKRIGKSRQ